MTFRLKDSFESACNYFALWELLGKRTQETSRIWRKMDLKVDTTQPLPSFIGDWTEAPFPQNEVRSVWTRVRSVMRENTAWGHDYVLDRRDPLYPTLLNEIDGAPDFLFLTGNLELLNRSALAIVGTRNPSSEGMQRAYKLACLTAENGIVVVSGLARGVDASAHKGAISVGGNTMAILGTPLRLSYPKENQRLQETIGKIGLLISQFYPGAGIRRHFFPMRNALMSGLCLGTVVIEASETSGALIQARQCLKQQRKLFIPKSAVENEALTWPKRFIQKGAHEFASIDELVGVLRRERLLPTQGTQQVLNTEVIRLSQAPCLSN
ncbi:MAG: DNA-processing protein DprA [Bacillota bacterium]|jgi:DNA processing protein